jgi:hypothetical protein
MKAYIPHGGADGSDRDFFAGRDSFLLEGEKLACMKASHRTLSHWIIPAIVAVLTVVVLSGLHQNMGRPVAVIAAVVLLAGC